LQTPTLPYSKIELRLLSLLPFQPGYFVFNPLNLLRQLRVPTRDIKHALPARALVLLQRLLRRLLARPQPRLQRQEMSVIRLQRGRQRRRRRMRRRMDAVRSCQRAPALVTDADTEML